MENYWYNKTNKKFIITNDSGYCATNIIKFIVFDQFGLVFTLFIMILMGKNTYFCTFIIYQND